MFKHLLIKMKNRSLQVSHFLSNLLNKFLKIMDYYNFCAFEEILDENLWNIMKTVN